jgi:serine O-acetyltransferase
MISSKSDYEAYLEADCRSLAVKKDLKTFVFDDIWRFERLMRRLEYYTNCKKRRFLRIIVLLLYRKKSKELGFSIPINVFGPGLSIAHRGTIIISGYAKIGANCRIHACVNIGTAAGALDASPIIGDNCYIGPGAKIFGKIHIGPNVAIGANAVVNKDFPEGNVTIGGIPARIISAKTSEGLLIRGYV